MKRILSLVLCGILITGCSSAPQATATPEATATVEATAEATDAPVSSEQQTADGVIVEAEMSTITVNVSGQEVTFLKADGITAQGEETPGTLVTITYEGTLEDNPTATDLLMNEATKSVTGTVVEDGMSAITVTVDGTNVSFLKDDSFVSIGECSEGSNIQVNYEGELDSEPLAYAVIVE